MTCPTKDQVSRYLRRQAARAAASAINVTPEDIRRELEDRAVAFQGVDGWAATLLRHDKAQAARIADLETENAELRAELDARRVVRVA